MNYSSKKLHFTVAPIAVEWRDGLLAESEKGCCFSPEWLCLVGCPYRSLWHMFGIWGRREWAAGLTRSHNLIQRAAGVGREPCCRDFIQTAAGLGPAEGHAGEMWSREHLDSFRRFRPIPQWWRWMMWAVGTRLQFSVGFCCSLHEYGKRAEESMAESLCRD